MIIIRTPNDTLFNYGECEELYNKCRDDLEDDEFRDVVHRTAFYSFIDWATGELIGCIYFYHIDGNLYVNAFANRGHHELNLECFKKSLSWWDCDVYARALHKTSRLCVLRAGFKRIKDNLFVYRRNK